MRNLRSHRSTVYRLIAQHLPVLSTPNGHQKADGANQGFDHDFIIVIKVDINVYVV